LVVAAVFLADGSLARADRPDRGPILGVEVGVAGIDTTSPIQFGQGVGKSLVFGWRSGRFAIEWHLLQTYHAMPSDERLRSDHTLGDISMTTWTMRYLLFAPLPSVWLVGGVGELSVPVISSTSQKSDVVDAFGVVAGGAIGSLVRGGFLVTVEGRAYVPVIWTLPRPYVVPTGDGPTGGVTYAPSTDDIDGVAWSFTLGVRVIM
jgi:hypothetical protein